MRHNPSAIIGALIVGAMVFMAVLAPFLAPFDPLRGNLSDSFLPPSPQHWMGTNIQGQDVLSRIIWGARLTLGIAVLSVTFGVIVGGFLGAIAGFFKGCGRRRSSCVPSTSCWPFPGSCWPSAS